LFEKITVNELIYGDFHVVTMAQNDFGQATFSVDITVYYSQLRVISNSGVAMMVIALFMAVGIYSVSLLHVSKKIDLFKLCKKKPLTQEEEAI